MPITWIALADLAGLGDFPFFLHYSIYFLSKTFPSVQEDVFFYKQKWDSSLFFHSLLKSHSLEKPLVHNDVGCTFPIYKAGEV